MGGTDRTYVQTVVGVGSTELGESGTARTVVVSRVEVDRTVSQRFQTGVGVGGTGAGGSGTARTMVVSAVEVGRTDKTG